MGEVLPGNPWGASWTGGMDTEYWMTWCISSCNVSPHQTWYIAPCEGEPYRPIVQSLKVKRTNRNCEYILPRFWLLNFDKVQGIFSKSALLNWQTIKLETLHLTKESLQNASWRERGPYDWIKKQSRCWFLIFQNVSLQLCTNLEIIKSPKRWRFVHDKRAFPSRCTPQSALRLNITRFSGESDVKIIRYDDAAYISTNFSMQWSAICLQFAESRAAAIARSWNCPKLAAVWRREACARENGQLLPRWSSPGNCQWSWDSCGR